MEFTSGQKLLRAELGERGWFLIIAFLWEQIKASHERTLKKNVRMRAKENRRGMGFCSWENNPDFHTQEWAEAELKGQRWDKLGSEPACILIASLEKPDCGQLEGPYTQRTQQVCCLQDLSPPAACWDSEGVSSSPFAKMSHRWKEFIFHHQRGKSLLDVSVGQRSPCWLPGRFQARPSVRGKSSLPV